MTLTRNTEPEEVPGEGARDEGLALPVVVGTRGDEPQAPRFFLMELLGEGGMGRVFRAYDAALDRSVALKLLRVGAAPSSSIVEAKAMAKVSHPNLAVVHDVGVHLGHPYIAMEYVRGRSLRARLSEAPDWRWREVLEIMRAAGEGLAALHRYGLLHRDFKPENLMLGDDGRVRIVDFGLAWSSRALGAPPGGTRGYTAPEQISGGGASPASDQYAYCRTFREALRGDAEDGDWRGAPFWLRRVISRGLSDEPAQRYPDMAALLHDLRQHERFGRRWPAVLAGLVVGLGLVAVGAALLRLEERRLARCEGDATLGGAWTPARAQALGRPVGAGQAAAVEESGARLRRLFDEYALEHQRRSREQCLKASASSNGMAPAPLARARSCLARGQRAAAALIEHALSPSLEAHEVDQLVLQALALPSLHACSDPAVAAGPPVPADRRLAERVHEVRAELAEARVHLGLRRREPALERVEAALSEARAAGYAPLVAEALYMRARLAMWLGTPEESVTLLREAIAVATRASHAGVLIDAWSALMGVTGVHQRRFAEAEQVMETARVAVALGDASEEQRADFLLYLGAMRSLQGRLPEAVELQREALTLHEKAGDERLERVAIAVQNLAASLMLLGRHADAEALLGQHEQRDARALGPGHSVVQELRVVRANALASLGRYPEAEESYAKAREVYERTGRTGHNFASLLVSMGQLYSVLNRHGDAARTLERARGVVGAELGVEHVLLQRIEVLLAWSAFQQGQPGRGLRRLEAALQRLVAQVGEDHYYVADARHVLGAALREAGRAGEAASVGRAALAGYEAVLGADSPHAAEASCELAKTLERLGRGGEAERLARAGLERLTALGVHPDTIATCRGTLARALWRSADRRAEALREARRAHAELLPYARWLTPEWEQLTEWLAARGGPAASRDVALHDG